MYCSISDLPASANCFVVESKLASETTTSSPEKFQVGHIRTAQYINCKHCRQLTYTIQQSLYKLLLNIKVQFIFCLYRVVTLCSFMGESSKFPKILNFRNSNFKTCRMPTKMNNFIFKCLIVFRSTEN